MSIGMTNGRTGHNQLKLDLTIPFRLVAGTAMLDQGMPEWGHSSNRKNIIRAGREARQTER
jgi:hypothetical protein